MRITIFYLSLGLIFSIIAFGSGAKVLCFFSGCENFYKFTTISLTAAFFAFIFLSLAIWRLIKLSQTKTNSYEKGSEYLGSSKDFDI